MNFTKFRIPIITIVTLVMIIVVLLAFLLFPELWLSMGMIIDTFMKEHPWIAGVLHLTASLLLIYVTYKHMREARKQRLRSLYSQLVNMLILPLIDIIDQSWKRTNIKDGLRAIHGSVFLILWDILAHEQPGISNVIVEHDDIIEQLEEARSNLINKLNSNREFREIVLRTLVEHFISYGLESRPESYIYDVICYLIRGGELRFGYNHEYCEKYENQLRETVKELGTREESIEELIMKIEHLERKLAELPEKQEVLNKLRSLAGGYTKEYGIILQQPEKVLYP